MKRLWGTLIVSLTLIAAQAHSDEYLIGEVEKVLKTLKANDPSKPALALHLADLHFDEASETFRKETLSGKVTSKIKHHRQSAVKLYYDVLSGFGGKFKSPSQAQKTKIEFQIARLHFDAGSEREALPIFEKLTKQEQNTEIRRESALRVAEIYEARDGNQAFLNAEKFFNLALSVCEKTDACSYSHYRLAWLYYRRNDFARALSHIEQSLYDSKSKPREEAIRDYVVMLGRTPGTSGQEELQKVTDLSKKLNRPMLIEDLAFQFYSAGNRPAGMKALEVHNQSQPSLKNTVRLLEDNYALRNYEGYAKHLLAIQKMNRCDVMAVLADNTREDGMEIEKIMRRLTVQLDGERTTRPERTGIFQETVDLYLALFPESKERTKMADGWLASEPQGAKKIERLAIYIADEVRRKDTKRELSLREMRGALAQKEKNYRVVADEMGVLAAKTDDAEKKEQYTYTQARALYELKEYDQAYPLFEKLAVVKNNQAPTRYAIQSLHLMLDILGQRKDFSKIATLASSWITHPQYDRWLAFVPKHRQDLVDLKKIADEAKFENASTGADKAASLASFVQMCREGKLTPQSCNNAKVLAVQLKNQSALIAVLKLQGEEDELAKEYEASGRWNEAAEMLRKRLVSAKLPDHKAYLKTALLYELGRNQEMKDKTLKELRKIISSQKKFSAGTEDLVYETFKDNELLDQVAWGLPWTKENRQRLADHLLTIDKGSPEVRAFVLKSCERTGPQWAKMALEKLRLLDSIQRRIDITGRQSQRKFESRVAGLQEMTKTGQCYLQGALSEERVIMAEILSRAHGSFAKAIQESPIPEGLPEESVQQIRSSLAQMAAPFAEKQSDYHKLALEQLSKIQEPSKKAEMEKYVAAETLLAEAPTLNEPSDLQIRVATSLLVEAEKLLHENPENVAALGNLRDAYGKAGNRRLQAYFEGRLNNVTKGSL